MKREEKGIGRSATDDAHLADAALESALGGFEFENHAAGDDAALDQALTLLAGDGGEDFFAVENTGDVGEIDQLVGVEKFGASGSHVIGVDVVKLVIGTEAEAGSDRNETFAPERFDEGVVQSSEIADEAEATGDFAVGHGLREETLSIGSGDANCGIAFGGNSGGKALVQQPGEDHDGRVARLAVGDAKAGDKLAFDAHALEGLGECVSATVNHENLVALKGESCDLPRECAHGRFVFEQSTSELDYGFH